MGVFFCECYGAHGDLHKGGRRQRQMCIRDRLPADTFRETYEEECGFDEIEIHTGAITREDTVLIHDSLLTTGGSMEAVYKLCQRFNPRRIYVNFLIELAMEGLNGRKALGVDKDITTLITVSR